MKRAPTTHHDIEEVIKKVKTLLPRVIVSQLTVTHDADDDGLWYFSLPDVEASIQVESSYGSCPFFIESDEHSSSNALEGTTVEQTVKFIVEYLSAASEGRSIQLNGKLWWPSRKIRREHLKGKIKAIRTQAERERWSRDATGSAEHTSQQTLYIVNIVSLFADSLEFYCDEHFPDFNPRHERRLAEMLEKLKVEHRLLDFDKCDILRARRNQCAHEFGTRCEWPEVLETIAAVEAELGHLGML